MNTQIAVVTRRSPSVKAAEHRCTPKRFAPNALPAGRVLVAETEAASSHSETRQRPAAPGRQLIADHQSSYGGVGRGCGVNVGVPIGLGRGPGTGRGNGVTCGGGVGFTPSLSALGSVTASFSEGPRGVGRGCGVGRGLGVALGVGVTVGVAVGVTDGVTEGVAVGVTVGVSVGVALGEAVGVGDGGGPPGNAKA